MLSKCCKRGHRNVYNRENAREIKLQVYCGSGTFCPNNCAKFYMGTFCRKFATDFVSKDLYVPRTVLSQGRFITKFLERKSLECYVRGRFVRLSVHF
jgi:hypothetical protein